MLSFVKHGKYIDVGCNHPTSGSVTKFFYDRGWSGINIDPLPDSINLYSKARPRDINLNMGVGDVVARLKYWARGALSTFNEEEAKRQGIENFIEAYSDVTTLNNILTSKYINNGKVYIPECDTFHFLKIDVEHYEVNVLKGIDLNRFKPWVIVVESTLPCTYVDCSIEFEPILLDNGYKFFIQNSINRYYILNEKYDEIINNYVVNNDPWIYYRELYSLIKMSKKLDQILYL